MRHEADPAGRVAPGAQITLDSATCRHVIRRSSQYLRDGFLRLLPLLALLQVSGALPVNARQAPSTARTEQPSAVPTPGPVDGDVRAGPAFIAAPVSRFGIGGLAGRTSGLTVRVILTEESRRSGPFEERAVDVNASFNLDGYLHVTAHVTAERPVDNSPLTFYMGPGWLAGADDGEAFFGVSGNIGIYFTMARYQILMQLMPGMQITPDVNGEIGAAVGMRVQF